MMELAERHPSPGAQGPERALVQPRIWARTVVSIAGSALLAAQAVALGALPWATRPGLIVTTFLLWPAALLICSGVWALHFALAPRVTVPVWLRILAPVALVGIAVLMPGMYLSNRLLVDTALQKPTLMGYALSGVAALAAALLLRSKIRRIVQSVPARKLVLGVAVMGGCTAAVLDAVFLTQAHHELHYLLLGVELVAFSFVAVHALIVWRAGAMRVGTALLFAYFILAYDPTHGSASAAYRAVLGTASPHQRLLLLVQRMVDSDGDGFSSLLGGPDCDDEDAAVFPLSTVGRDCLGWAERAVPPAHLEAHTGRPTAASPRLIVLVTIDAFRCGFGSHDLPTLRAECPEIEELATEGQARFDAYTTYPSTGTALGSLHSGKLVYSPSDDNTTLLADWLGQRGWQTAVISTHPYQLSEKLERSFQHADRSLEDHAPRPASVSSAQTTDLALSTIRHHFSGSARSAPLFLWVHYFDPHAPYLDRNASSWAISADIDRYADEIRRTSRHVGRLAREVGKTKNIPGALLLITTDHGEEFGEKDTTYHGASVNDFAVRIPMLVWSPDPSLIPKLPKSLPASTIEVAPYLAAASTGGSFASRDEAFFMTREHNNPIFGFYRDGWKLIHYQQLGTTVLYHIPTDPYENVNLASQQPAIVEDLGQRLAGYLRASWPGFTDTVVAAGKH